MTSARMRLGATWANLRHSLSGPREPQDAFWFPGYLKITQRRLEHLASLDLPIAGRSVLEVGAGAGDLTSFFLDRGCRVVTSDGRSDNVAFLRRRFPELEVLLLDLDQPGDAISAEIVCCYGVLYHLSRPAIALAYLRSCCTGLLLVETCVSAGTHSSVNPVAEPSRSYSQAITGQGCRPTRRWVFDELARHFPHVYVTRTQPWHSEFPIDWMAPPTDGLIRSIFVASTEPLDNEQLIQGIPDRQMRH